MATDKYTKVKVVFGFYTKISDMSCKLSVRTTTSVEIATRGMQLSVGHKHNNLLMPYGQSDIMGIHGSTDVFSLREINEGKYPHKKNKKKKIRNNNQNLAMYR
jgi:hypothetical protein